MKQPTVKCPSCDREGIDSIEILQREPMMAGGSRYGTKVWCRCKKCGEKFYDELLYSD